LSLEEITETSGLDLVPQRTAVEKSIGLLVHTCNLARSNVQKRILMFWLSEHESRVHYIRVH
jgi:hypothetical protein